MQIDLNQEETQVLLIALRIYKSLVQEQEENVAKIEEARRARLSKEPMYCCLKFEESPQKVPPRRDDKFMVELRDKLKKFQMMFPCEDHNYKQYSYGKNFGYEKAKWVQLKDGDGITPGFGGFQRLES